MTPQVMVLGANGRLGHAAVQAFAAAGWHVFAQARQAPRSPLPAGAHPLQADALDTEQLRWAAPRLDLIVNALSPDYTRWATLLPPITQATLALAEATGATLMLPGNVYNFGNQLPALLTEQTPFAATHPKAAQRIALEAELAAAGAATETPHHGGVRSIVVRAGDFLGDAGTWFDMGYARQLRRGRVTHMGPADLQHAWSYLPDLAQVMVKVAGQRQLLPPHAVLHYAGLTLTGDELHGLLETAVGQRLKRARFPWWLMRLSAPFAAMPRALLEMRYLWQRPHRLDETALRALIGEVPHTDAEQVLRNCVAALPDALRPAAGSAENLRSATRSAG